MSVVWLLLHESTDRPPAADPHSSESADDQDIRGTTGWSLIRTYTPNFQVFFSPGDSATLLQGTRLLRFWGPGTVPLFWRPCFFCLSWSLFLVIKFFFLCDRTGYCVFIVLASISQTGMFWAAPMFPSPPTSLPSYTRSQVPSHIQRYFSSQTPQRHTHKHIYTQHTPPHVQYNDKKTILMCNDDGNNIFYVSPCWTTCHT